MTLSLVLPCFNEEKNVRTAVLATQSWMQERSLSGEIIVVDDGSRDQTAAVLEALKNEVPTLVVLRHPENRGYGAALLTGLDQARGELMGFMDSDGQFDPKNFDRLLPLLSDASFVTGRRLHRADPLPRKLNAKLFGFLSFIFLGIWVRDINCAMKLWHRDIWAQIRPRHSTGALFNAEMFQRLRRHRIPWKQVDVDHFPRKFGAQTGAKLSVILRMFRELWELRISRGD
ncbi:MAG: glycosyltransferase family 2 protein [Candidatus Peribacteraceae bacterium]